MIAMTTSSSIRVNAERDKKRPERIRISFERLIHAIGSVLPAVLQAETVHVEACVGLLTGPLQQAEAVFSVPARGNEQRRTWAVHPMRGEIKAEGNRSTSL